MGMRIGLMAAVLVLAGCASDGVGPAAPTESAGTLGASGFVWQVMMADEAPHARLMYAPRASDHILATLSCTRASGRVSIETFNPGTDGTKLQLGSGKTAALVAARRLPPDEFYGDAVVSVVELEAGFPVLAAFRQNGLLITGMPPAVMSAGTPEEREAIGQFFDVCGG
jgi:hypothetical protein